MDDAEREKLEAVYAEMFTTAGSIRRVLVPYVRGMLTPEQERAVEFCTHGDDRLTAMMEFCTAFLAQKQQPQTFTLPAIPNLRS